MSPQDEFVRLAVAFDTETHLIQPGLLAPPLVCGSIASAASGSVFATILDKGDTLEAFTEILHDRIIVGANIAYDMLVMAQYAARQGQDILPLIFRAYDEGRVYDVQIAEALHALARGHLGKDPRTGGELRSPSTGRPAHYSLEVCTDLVLGETEAKANDEWRLRYAELDGKPIAEWPEVARVYPVDDARNTLRVALAQFGCIANTGAHHWAADACLQCRAPLGHPGPCVSAWPRENLHDLPAQVYTAFCLHLGAAWGFRVDPTAVTDLEVRVTADRASDTSRFAACGFLRADGSKDTTLLKSRLAVAYGAAAKCGVCRGTGKVPSDKTGKPVQCASCGSTGYDLANLQVPRTEKDGVSIARDALNESGDDDLMAFAEYGEDSKTIETYLPYLKKGIGVALNLRPNVLLETGRVSYRDVIQQIPRKGGIRECFIPRDGYMFCSVDYEAGELITHAQSCIWLVGESALADALVRGVKPHNALAASMLGITYESFQDRFKLGDTLCKDTRQAAKAANFGFPGGMGPPKFAITQRASGPDTLSLSGVTYKGLRPCILVAGAARCGAEKVTQWGAKGREQTFSPVCKRCIECATDLREAWFSTWHENRLYFKAVAERVESYGYVLQHVTERKRGGVEFTSAANGYFQALLADVTKKALRSAVSECYVGTGALRGSRVIAFMHDELIAEVPFDRAHDAATRIGVIMEDALKEYCPDLAPAVHAEPALMRRWYKGAETRRDAAGRLIPWEPGANA